MIHPSIELSLYVIVNNTMQRNLIIYAANAVFFAFYIFRIRLPPPRRGEVVRVVHGYNVPLLDRFFFKFPNLNLIWIVRVHSFTLILFMAIVKSRVLFFCCPGYGIGVVHTHPITSHSQCMSYWNFVLRFISYHRWRLVKISH